LPLRPWSIELLAAAATGRGAAGPEDAVSDAHAYCRAIEAHLCRRNGGHLIRVVGPAFDLVKEWAELGIPLAVACAGIDRTVDRAARKPGRRRPLRLEFCDADVRATYDEWSRAIGPALRPSAGDGSAAAVRRGSLAQHLDRAIAQLQALRAAGRAAALEPVLAETLAALDAARDAATTARGAAREALIADLQARDAALGAAAVEALDEEERRTVRREAEAEIAGFRVRLAAAQWEVALAAAGTRLARLRLGLPAVAFD
jgi:hypothetical protein